MSSPRVLFASEDEAFAERVRAELTGLALEARRTLAEALAHLKACGADAVLLDPELPEDAAQKDAVDAIATAAPQAAILLVALDPARLPVEALRRNVEELAPLDAPIALEEKLRSALRRKQIRREEEGAAVSRLAASVAHEINNPAAFMLANLTVLQDHLAKLENVLAGAYAGEASDRAAAAAVIADAKEIAAENLDGIRRIAAVVRRLRTFEREESTLGPGPSGDPVRALRVLIVDDEDFVLRAFRRMLDPPHSVVAIESAGEAMQLLAADKSFDAIVCDLMMPDVDGLALYEHVVESHPELARRIIFCSGGVFTDRLRTFVATLPNILLSKPVAQQQLRDAVHRVAPKEE